MLVASKRDDSLRKKTSREPKEDEPPKHFYTFLFISHPTVLIDFKSKLKYKTSGRMDKQM